MKSNVTIPAKHYVGMTMRHGQKIPLGFITPWGEDKAAEKRIETVDRWCGAGKADAIPTSVIENIPMHGFKLTAGIRTGQYGASDQWRIEDPRGFELEISSYNLAMVLSVCTLEKGEILEKCVWARDKGKNVLLTTESQDYIDAVEMTTIAGSSASWKDVKPGNRITLQNGISGQYLGKFHAIREVYRDYEIARQNIIEPTTASVHFILDKNYTGPYDKKISVALHALASPKLSSIDDTSELSVSECEILATAYMKDKSCTVMMSGYRGPHIASANKIKDKTWTLSLVLDTDISNPWTFRKDDSANVYVRMANGDVGEIKNNSYHNHKNEITLIDITKLSTGVVEYITTKSSRSYRWNDVKDTFHVETKEVDPNDIQGIYRLVLNYTTAAGSNLTVNI